MKLELLEAPTGRRLLTLPEPAMNTSRGPAGPAFDQWTILLISGDAEFNWKFRRAAKKAGREVVLMDGTADSVETVRTLKPAAVLLDLELAGGAAWAAADRLLQYAKCPPLFLLASHRDRFDVRRAISEGTVANKSSEPAELLRAVENALEAPAFAANDHPLHRVVVVRWLHPYSSPVPIRPPERFWGINE